MAAPSRAFDPRPRARWIGVATALMTALAGGALWCLIALYARHDLIALSLPIAAAVAWALRSHGFTGRWFGAVIAVACVALASAYSLYLQAAAQVASMLGPAAPRRARADGPAHGDRHRVGESRHRRRRDHRCRRDRRSGRRALDARTPQLTRNYTVVATGAGGASGSSNQRRARRRPSMIDGRSTKR